MARLFGALGVFLVALAASFGTPASAQDAYLTRIEPRPFYGATITIEEGVRVFRPLPSTRQIIINPNQTPLNLTFNDQVVRQPTRNDAGDATDNGNGYADSNNGSNDTDQGGSWYGSYGNSKGGTYGGSYSGNGGQMGYGAKGKRLSGFGSHGVRVNGQIANYADAANHYAPQQVSKQRNQRTMAHHPGRKHPASHGFVYGGNGFAGRPMHLPPMGYGAPRYAHAQRYPQHHALPNVHRPMMRFPMRSHGPVIAHAPMRPPVMMAPPIQSYRMLPAPAPKHAAPAAAPTHAYHGHAAPAGRMGIGMGGMGHGRGR